jgi:antirestriction protein ArdC
MLKLRPIMSGEQTPRKFYINKFLSDQFVARIKEGLIPWRRPWIGKVPLQNGISGHQYQGLNVFQLTLASIENDFRQPYWLTWNQVHKQGGEILPEHKRNGTMFVFYKDHPIKEMVQAEDPETGELIEQEVEKKVPLLRYGTLYNIAQCKNLRLTDLPAYKAAERFEQTEDRDLVKLTIDFLKQSPDNPEIVFSDEATEAYYDGNKLVTPPNFKCETDEDFAFGLFKAAVSASPRTNRPTFQDQRLDHQHNEIIKEIGAGLLCGKLGIRPPQVVEDDTVQSWIRAMNQEPRLLVRAAGQAQKAVSAIAGIAQERTQTQTHATEPVSNIFGYHPPQSQTQSSIEAGQFTAIDHLYRDAGNYKQFESYVVEGELSFSQLEPYLKDGAYFVGKDVQMEDLAFRFVTRDGMDLNEDDHPWQEIQTVAQTTPELASQAKEEGRFLGSAAELVERFKNAAKANWPSYSQVADEMKKYAGLDPQQTQDESERQNRSIGY